ncbi:hypothetical protein WR25_01181 [Diploscapter pachys]|uniref:Uncharacterized protein n=1 Tax=Diploscapter pachys TaxID=2018661 RepID=A0A2A2K214_9BILA|nr:hypothetical protein WR25_01181 [Diploscapter pachys]
MFVMHSKPATYAPCSGPFASSSCQTEFDGKMEAQIETKCTLGMGSGMRRNSSNLSQLSSYHHSHETTCPADATQIEIDFSAITSKPFDVVIHAPNGEEGRLEFEQYGTAQIFTPHQHGCGHGLWTFEVRDRSGSVVNTEKMQLDGVGSLFFTVGDDLAPRLSGQEFLYMSRPCPKSHH